MNIVSFLKSLVNMIKKPVITEDARITASELKLKTIPEYEAASKQFKSKFLSDEALELSKDYANHTGNHNANMIQTITKKLGVLEEVLGVVATVVEKRFEETTMVGGMTVLKANVIKLLDSSAFISSYALNLLNYIYVCETAAKLGTPDYIGENISNGQIKYVKTNFYAFCKLLDAIALPSKEVEEKIESIPDVQFGNEPEMIAQTFDDSKLNPFAIMHFNHPFNLIYHVRMIIAESQANRYKRAQELKKILELRRLKLEKANRDNPDANLDQQIAYTQSRIDALSEKIRQEEESVQ